MCLAACTSGDQPERAAADGTRDQTIPQEVRAELIELGAQDHSTKRLR
jgi:hypothetical protein